MGRRRWLLREGMKRQHAEVMRRHKRELGRYYRGKEGKWSEKLITFTVTHGDSPAEDARVIVNAWQKMLRKIRTHLMKRGAVRRSKSGKLAPISVPWCRALEVGTGKNGGGREAHAHLHVWWVGPFLDVVLLRKWWGELIIEAGREVPARQWKDIQSEGRDRRLAAWMGNPAEENWIPWPVVDVRSEKSDGIAAYTQKVGLALYTQKGGEIHLLSPAHAAAIYEVFEGTRAVQWARGWAPVRPRKHSGARFRRLTEKEREGILQRRVSRVVTSQNVQNTPDAQAASAQESITRVRCVQLTFDHM
jgi:hypothetical protein